jgi:hypothetical protein
MCHRPLCLGGIFGEGGATAGGRVHRSPIGGVDFSSVAMAGPVCSWLAGTQIRLLLAALRQVPRP